MKRTLINLAVAGALSVALVGCEFVGVMADRVREDLAAVRQLKAVGCAKLSPERRKVLVRIAKFYIPHYPNGGICNPEWVKTTLVTAVTESLPAGIVDDDQPLSD